MRILTIRGRSMKEALDRVRREAGEDAVILSTGTSLGGECEVSIAVERPSAARTPSGRRAPTTQAKPTQRSTAPERTVDDVHRRLDVLESFIRFKVPHESPIFTRLLDAGVEESLVRRIAESCAAVTDRETEAHVRRKIARLLEKIDPLKVAEGANDVVAFVGPTGAGKTTTIAKLAARFSLSQRKRVGLITEDTQRIAAVQQLRTYARILDLPLRTLARPQDAASALAALADRDIILVDTSGIGGRSTDRVGTLRGILDALGTREVILTIAATASASDVRAAAKRLEALHPSRIVVTKIDETVRPGVLLTCADLGLPFSHLTHGQAVPDDIAPARADRLVAEILGEADVV